MAMFALLGQTPGNGYEGLEQAAQLIDKPELFATLPQSGQKDWLEKRRSIVAASEKAYPLVAIAVTKPILWPNGEITPATTFPNLWKVKRLSKALLCRSIVSCADGRPNESAQAISDGIVLSTRFGFSADSFHYLVGAKMLRDMGSAFDHDKRQLTLSGLRQIRESVDQCLAERPFANYVRRQQRILELWCDELVQNPTLFVTHLGLKKEEMTQYRLDSMSVSQRETIRSQVIGRSRQVTELVAKFAATPEDDWEGSLEALSLPELDPVGELLFTLVYSVEEVADIELDVRTVLRLIRLHCAVLEHKWKTGLPPVSLDAFPADLSTDPQRGKSFAYSLAGKGYKLGVYDVGGKPNFDYLNSVRWPEVDQPEDRP